MKYGIQRAKFGFWVVKFEDRVTWFTTWEHTFKGAIDVARALNVNSRKAVS